MKKILAESEKKWETLARFRFEELMRQAERAYEEWNMYELWEEAVNG